MYGSAWESELKDMLMTIWSVRGLGLEEVGRMQEAVEEAERMLRKSGLITVEEKERGDLGRSGPVREKLYKLQNLFQVMKLLGRDPELDRVRLQLQGQL